MFGQKKKPADVKTQPLDEFITQTSNNSAQAAEEMAARPKNKATNELKAKETDEEAAEADKKINKPDAIDEDI